MTGLPRAISAGLIRTYHGFARVRRGPPGDKAPDGLPLFICRPGGARKKNWPTGDPSNDGELHLRRSPEGLWRRGGQSTCPHDGLAEGSRGSPKALSTRTPLQTPSSARKPLALQEQAPLEHPCEALLPPLRDMAGALHEGRRWPRDGPECPQDAQRGHQEDAQGAIKL